MSMQWNAYVAQTRPQFILLSERVVGNGVQTHVNSKENTPLPEAERRVKSMMQHHAGRQAQHTKDPAIPAPDYHQKTSVDFMHAFTGCTLTFASEGQ